MMARMNDMSRALQLYLGRGRSSFPCARADRVREVFDDAMLEEISRLVKEMDGLPVDWQTHSLISATTWAEAEIRRRHPELDDEAIADLGWAFSYWHK